MTNMRHRSRVLVVAIVVSFIAFLDGAVINVALPALAADLGGGLSLQQWAVDAYLLTLGALILLAGSLSDSYGRVRMVVIGLVVFGVTSIACALAPDGVFFVVARALQGAGGALLVPASLALIVANYPHEEQGRAIGRWTAWTTAAFLIGPLLGGVLIDLVSWRLVFWINLLPIVAALWLIRGLDRETRPEHTPRIDWTGAVLGIVGLGGTVFALIEQGRLGWADPLVWVPLVVGILSLIAFVWQERRTPEPMLPLSLFRARNFAVGNLATLFVYAGFSLGPFAITIFLQQVAGFSATAAGLATLPPTIMMVALGSLFGTLSGRFGPRLFMALGPTVCAIGFLLTLAVAQPVDYWWQFLPGIVLLGLGMSITVAPLTAAILGAVDPARAGIGSAVNNAVSRIAGLLAIASVGVIAGTQLDVGGYHRVAIATAAVLLVGGATSAIGIRNPVTRASESAPPAPPAR